MKNDSLDSTNITATKDIKRYAIICLKKWYLYVIALSVAFTISFLVNRYTHPVYIVSSSVLINTSKDLNNPVLDLLYGDEIGRTQKRLNNEMYILNSHRLVEHTIQELDWKVTYYKEGNIKTSEIYSPSSPFRVIIDTSANNEIPYGKILKIKIFENNYFQLSDIESNNAEKFKFGKKINYNGAIFTVVKKNHKKLQKNKVYLFQFNKLKNLSKRYQNKIIISPPDNQATILNVSLHSELPEKDIDFINMLLKVYLKEELDEKNLNAKKTIEFIDFQLRSISDSLKFIESRIQSFKQDKSISDLNLQLTDLYQKLQTLDEEKGEYLVFEKYYQYLVDYLNNTDPTERIVTPSAIGIQDQLLNSLIGKFVDLQINYRLLKEKQYSENNPEIKRLLGELDEVKNNLKENLNTLIQNNIISINDINTRIGKLEAKLRLIPKQERQFMNLTRSFELTEQIYVFLLRKKTEAEIAKASSTPDNKIIDEAMKGSMIYPQVFRNNLIALVLGLFFPTCWALLVYLLNSKITNRQDLQAITQIPFLGIIGHNNTKKNLVLTDHSKSPISESFRSIRSNLQYVNESHKKVTTMMVTSSISGEGKSFFSINLAHVQALSGKKTVLIGADLRKPNKFPDLQVTNENGLSAYLAGMAEIESIITKTEHDNLSLIRAISTPPNPSELLLSERFRTLMEYLKKHFDVIIIDTPPIGIISDPLSISPFVDTIIYLVRQNYTPKSSVRFIDELYKDEKLKNIYIVMNDYTHSKSYGYEYSFKYAYGHDYGYGYGYGYYDESNKKRSFLKRIFRI